METKKNRTCEPSHSYENLTLLLKNEYNRQSIKNKQKCLKEYQKKGDKRVSKDLKASKSGNENGLDLVINVEVCKHESNLLDAYYTDLDLRGRKAYHETMAKREHLANKSRFPELNLIYSEEISNNLPSANPSRYFNRPNTGCTSSTDDISLDNLFGTKGCTKTFYNRSYKVDKESHKYSYQSNESKIESWSPFRYKMTVPSVNSPGNCNTLETYEERKLERHRTTKFDRMFSNCEPANKISLEFIRRETKLKRNLEVPSLRLNNCNTFPLLKNQFSILSDSTGATDDCDCVNSDCQFENTAITFSDPEINVHRATFENERLEYRKICSTISFSESSVKVPSSINFQIYNNTNYINSSAMFLESQFYKKNVYEFDQDEMSRVVVRQNSFVTNISGGDEIENNIANFKDICYLEKKYARENSNKFEPGNENTELSNILNIHDSNLLNFDFNVETVENSFDNSYNIQKDIMLATDEIGQSDWFNSKIQNKMLLEKINMDNTTNKIKTLEVLFPVKSLRTCIDSVDENIGSDTSANNELLVDEPSLKSIIEVEYMKKTVLSTFQSMDIIKECGSKTFTTDDNYTIAKDDVNIKLFNSTLIAGNYSDENICSDAFDIKMILNSKEFKKEVLNIIEGYLEENYLKDDDFDVLIVPKNVISPRNSDPIKVLKKIINQKLSRNKYDVDARIRQHDLSTFNPRDFKGYVMKYEKMYNDSPTIRSTNRSTKKKQHNEGPSQTGYKTALLVRPTTVKTMDQYTGKQYKGLSKIMSMPVFKLKSSSSFKMRNKFETQVYKSYNGFTECNNDSRSLIVATKNSESNIIHQYLPYLMNSNILYDFPKYDTVKDRPPRSKKRKQKHEKCEFFTEFNEFKQIFDQVDVKHDALIHALNYDPCGFLFKFKKSQCNTTERK